VTDRKAIAARILDVLQRGIPLRARQITARIREHNPREDVTLQNVNSVLYRELSNTVAQNGSYEWAIRPLNQPALPHLLRTTEELDDRAACLRAVQRVRAGLPPQERIAELTVADHRDIMQTVLCAMEPSGRWLIVGGEYGCGKSHTLTLFANEAQRQGYATCHLSADAAGSALNHPQRFLPLLLGTLELPGRTARGYQDFLYDILDDERAVTAIRTFVAQRLADTTQLRRALDDRLGSLQNAKDTDPADLLVRKQGAISLLSGDSIATRLADPSARSQAYELLGIAQDTIIACGARGLALIIDEGESIYTKLARSTSRYGAFRVLAALSMSTHLSYCRLAIAVTPDALHELRRIDVTAAQYGCVPTEPLEAWAHAIRDDRVPIITCRPLTEKDKTVLLSKVAVLYARAYPALLWTDSLTTEWQAFQHTTASSQLTVRIAVRRVVDYLDTRRCSLRRSKSVREGEQP
jgi:hypothetical protein